MCKPRSVDFSCTSSKLCHQAFIDSMEKFNNFLNYKELIWSVLYVRFIMFLTETKTIFISKYMEDYRIPQRPQVRGLPSCHILLTKPDPLL